jgi:tetratricopeptide (TPR) repeat protein
MKRYICLYSIFLPALWTALFSCTRQAAVSGETVRNYLTAKELYTSGDLPRAERQLRDLTLGSPSFYQGRLLYAKTLMYQKNRSEAETVLLKLIEDYPCYREAELLYIRLLLGKDDLDGAEKRINSLLSYDSADPRLLYLKARVSQYRDKTADSLRYLQQAALFREEFAGVFLDLGRIYYTHGRNGDAEDSVAAAVRLLPSDSILYRPVRELLKKIRGESNEQ